MRLRGIAVSLSCALSLSLFVGGGVARASSDGGSDAGNDDLATLEQQLADESSALSTSDCHDACRALASIHRAVDRICSLEPGPRCSAARAKSEDATRRVREACPDCAIAAPPTQINRQRGDVLHATESMPANAPEPSRGGCRSCTAAGATASLPDLGWFAALAWLAARTRRKKPRPP